MVPLRIKFHMQDLVVH